MALLIKYPRNKSSPSRTASPQATNPMQPTESFATAFMNG